MKDDKVGFYKFTKADIPPHLNNDQAINKLVQKMRLYEDMIEVIKLAIDWWPYQTGSDFKELAQSTLDRAEKLKRVNG